MNQLLAAIVLIAVFAIAVFFYRNTLVRPAPLPVVGAACGTEVLTCPDGQTVHREGVNCAFAVCPLPNVEDKTLGIAFVIPPGYVSNLDAIGTDATLRAVYDKPSTGSVPHSIVIRHFAIETGKTATSTILSHTMFESSGATATSLKQFTEKKIGTNTYLCVQLERFEGNIHTACYLARSTDVLCFEILEKDVTSWTDPALVVENLPQHKAFYSLLATLQLK